MNLRRNVLILDQVGKRCRNLECLLEKAGHTVSCAANGNDGLARARELTPDLVLLNVQLRNPSAWDVCRRLKQEPPASDSQVIVVFPGLGDPLVPMEEIMCRMDGFIDYSLIKKYLNG